MRHKRRIWLILVPILVFGCSTSNSNSGENLPSVEAKVPDAFVAPEYSAAKGSGPGVTVDGRITRGTLNLGMNSFPIWKVELTVANHTASAVRLGESMTILEKLPNVDDMVGIYIARESKRPTGQLKRMSTRYGLLWGLSVGLDFPGVWPFGALPGGSSMTPLDALVLVASMKLVKPYYPEGGYPSVPAGQQLVIREEIVVPLKSQPQSTILLAPIVLEDGKAPVQFALRFSSAANAFTSRVGEDATATEGLTLSPVESRSYSPGDPALALLPSDTSQPMWLRLHALNWLAEARFEEALPALMRFASDQSAPANLRVAALLNLGLHQHKPAVSLLLTTLENQTDALHRAVGITALGEMGDPAVAPQMRKFLDDQDETVVRETVAALGKLKDAESVGPLLKMLVDAKREKQYDGIALALTQIGTSESWSGILSIGSERKSGTKPRGAAIEAIGNAAYSPAVEMLSSIAADEGDDSSLRSSAISSLAKIGSPEAWVAIKAASAARQESVAETALRAMSQSKENTHKSYVISTAGTAGDRMQETAIRLIYQEKLGGAGPTLRMVIQNPATPAKLLPNVVKALAATGEKVGPDDLAPLWTAYRKESDPAMGEILAAALIEAQFNEKSVLPGLIAGLDEEKNKLWYSHVMLLRHLTGEKIGPEYRFGEKKVHKADFDRWREWWARQPK